MFSINILPSAAIMRFLRSSITIMLCLLLRLCTTSSKIKAVDTEVLLTCYIVKDYNFRAEYLYLNYIV